MRPAAKPTTWLEEPGKARTCTVIAEVAQSHEQRPAAPVGFCYLEGPIEFETPPPGAGRRRLGASPSSAHSPGREPGP